MPAPTPMFEPMEARLLLSGSRTDNLRTADEAGEGGARGAPHVHAGLRALRADETAANTHGRARANAKARARRAIIRYAAATLHPLTQGATWTYRSGTDLFERTILDAPTTVSGVTTVKLFDRRDGQQIALTTVTSSTAGVRIVSRELSGPAAVDSETYPAGGALVLPNAVVTGAKPTSYRLRWQGVADAAAFPWSGSDARSLSVLKMDTLTVAAGTFKAVHVRETRSAQQYQDNLGPISVRITQTTDAWYAPGVGLIRSVVTTKRTAFVNSAAVESTASTLVTDLQSTNQTYLPPRPDLLGRVEGKPAIQGASLQKVVVSASVFNVGRESARSSVMTAYLSTDRTVDFSDPAVGAVRIPALLAGRTAAKNLKLRLPRTPGTYYLRLYADAASEVDDPARDNNWTGVVKVTVKKPGQK